MLDKFGTRRSEQDLMRTVYRYCTIHLHVQSTSTVEYSSENWEAGNSHINSPEACGWTFFQNASNIGVDIPSARQLGLLQKELLIMLIG